MKNKEKEFGVCFWYKITGYLELKTPQIGCRVIEFKAQDIKVAADMCYDLWIELVKSKDQSLTYTLENMDLFIN